MQTALSKELLASQAGQEAESILRACVHCGFCTATCPTYKLTGNELDGPRGRIYLIKQMMEGAKVSSTTQYHLDRCLMCRSCETTCPSGVEYGHLLETGRQLIESKVKRLTWARLQRWVLRKILPYPSRFKPLLRLGQWLGVLFPAKLKSKIPPRQRTIPRIRTSHQRKMLIFEGCVQSVATPQTNIAVARVFDRLGISLVSVKNQGCCGAIDQHLAAKDQARELIKRNIDAWWDEIEAGAEAIIVTASGCAVQIKDYGYLLREDKDYAEKSARVSEITKDLSEVIAAEDLEKLKTSNGQRIAFHSPCTLQHGLKLTGKVESILRRLGYECVEVADTHLCCGSAGTYSIFQPELSNLLRTNKLEALEANLPELIATANVGCQLHLQSQSGISVIHWIELLDK